MRSRKQTPPELNGDHIDDPATGQDSAAVDALALADAEAAEAEAVAAAARARAKALRLRSEAEAAKAAETVAPPEPEDDTGREDVAEEGKGKEAADADGDGSEVAAIDASDDAVAVEHDGPGNARRGLRIRTLLPSWKAVAATVTVLVIAALLAGCGYMYWSHRQMQAEQQRRAEFEAAARQGVVTLMSLDFNHAKEDVQRIIDNSTGQFKADFQNTAEDFVNVAMDSKAVTETNVTATAVESMTGGDTATVLVAATSRVTNAAGAKQEPRAWRLTVNLARDGGQLKLAKVEFVP
jgi:Mce-associated membrane protein